MIQDFIREHNELYSDPTAIRDGAVRSASTELAREIDYELRPFARLKERVLEKLWRAP